MVVSVQLHSSSPFPRENIPPYALNRRLGGPQSWSGFLEKRKNLLPVMELDCLSCPDRSIVTVPTEPSGYSNFCKKYALSCKSEKLRRFFCVPMIMYLTPVPCIGEVLKKSTKRFVYCFYSRLTTYEIHFMYPSLDFSCPWGEHGPPVQKKCLILNFQNKMLFVFIISHFCVSNFL